MEIDFVNGLRRRYEAEEEKLSQSHTFDIEFQNESRLSHYMFVIVVVFLVVRIRSWDDVLLTRLAWQRSYQQGRQVMSRAESVIEA